MLTVRNFITGEKMEITDAMRRGVIVVTSNTDDAVEKKGFLTNIIEHLRKN
ncbi:hypothetical protein IKF20_00370 [Candidatus Saccharibacteria bacterium]|nr:hypothetical protein [Candidatus Saccharibacteria bacterium]